jgi:hypothetical protein
MIVALMTENHRGQPWCSPGSVPPGELRVPAATVGLRVRRRRDLENQPVPNGARTTIHYKSATRAHSESMGYDIVANFGDQFSDLKGGHADRTFKLPNPNYFLP